MMVLISKLRQSTKIKKSLLIFVEVMAFIYLFFIPSFSGRHPFNYVGYFLFGILAICTFLYIFLYDVFIIKTEWLFLPLFALTSFLSTLFGSHEFRRWLTILMMAASFFVMMFVFRLIKEKKKIIKLFVFAMLAFSVYFIVIYNKQLLDIKNFSNMRLGDYFDNVNQVGFYFCFASIFSFYLALFKTHKRDNLYYFLFLIFSVLGFTTGSRTTLICILVGLVCLIIMRFKRKKVLLITVLVSLIIVMIILFNLPFMETLRKRFLAFFATMNGVGAEGSTLTRILWQEYGFYYGVKNLFFGLGEGAFTILSGVGTYTHSDFSEIFCNFGFIGFMAYYATFFATVYYASTTKAKNSFLAIVIVIIYCILGFLSVKYYNKITPFLFATMLYFSQPNTFQNIVEVRI